MKVLKGGLVLLMAVAMVVTAGQLAFADRSGTQAPTDEPPITVNSKAPGKVVDAIVGLLYDKEGDPASCTAVLGPTVKMTLIMSLQLDRNTIVPFGGAAFNLCYWNFEQQDAALHNFIREKVLPYLYTSGFSQVEEPCFAIKSVTSAIDDIEGDFCEPAQPNFSLLQLQIAIDTKTSCPAPAP